jgi:hypothetical protein
MPPPVIGTGQAAPPSTHASARGARRPRPRSVVRPRGPRRTAPVGRSPHLRRIRRRDTAPGRSRPSTGSRDRALGDCDGQCAMPLAESCRLALAEHPKERGEHSARISKQRRLGPRVDDFSVASRSSAWQFRPARRRACYRRRSVPPGRVCPRERGDRASNRGARCAERLLPSAPKRKKPRILGAFDSRFGGPIPGGSRTTGSPQGPRTPNRNSVFERHLFHSTGISRRIPRAAWSLGWPLSEDSLGLRVPATAGFGPSRSPKLAMMMSSGCEGRASDAGRSTGGRLPSGRCPRTDCPRGRPRTSCD